MGTRDFSWGKGGQVRTAAVSPNTTSLLTTAAVAQVVPGSLRPRLFLTFGTTRVVGRQPYAPGRLYHRRNSWYSFLKAESTPGHIISSVVAEPMPDKISVHHKDYSLSSYGLRIHLITLSTMTNLLNHVA
jgi:hypothetical protein